jgi:acyl-CoA hydrolase/ribosomal protein S18 acetylase RimI-like enzyme
MSSEDESKLWEKVKTAYPEKFVPEEDLFGRIHRGDRIFISTACGEPQYLVQGLIHYVESHPKAFYGAEVFHVVTLGVAPYTDKKFKDNFRYNAFFIGKNSREAVNQGLADYSPIFLSQVPELFRRGLVPINVTLIQTSLPDDHGYLSLGVSVDIVKAAVEKASLVIAQVNASMPRVHGDGFVHIEDIDYLLRHDEPILEYEAVAPDEVARQIGKYIAQIVQDGDTIQVGYGSLPNAILAHLKDKNHLGVHTELLTDGVVELMKRGVIDNTLKTRNRGKTVATFCMGRRETYAYVHDNPGVEFRTIDYTNNPLIIAQQKNMTAINSALEIDLTGQATAESLGKIFFSGIGGQADFMRGAVLAPGGKSILAIQSRAEGGKVSRIVPFLRAGAAVTLIRGDIHYVVTEYGIAYLHGKNIRERAMALIAIAHPEFRPWLIEEARAANFIYRDQACIPGKRGEYPEHLEVYRTTPKGLPLFLRPVKISDEPLIKDFFYSLSDQSLYRRFISYRQDMPHERLQEFVIIDYTKEMLILACLKEDEREKVVGIGQYFIHPNAHRAEIALAVRDEYQGRGIGWELLSYLTYLAKREGLLGFTAEVLMENRPMLHLFDKMGFDIKRRIEERVYEMEITFRDQEQ